MIAVMNLSSMLTAMRNAEATPALEQQQEYRGDQDGKFV